MELFSAGNLANHTRDLYSKPRTQKPTFLYRLITVWSPNLGCQRRRLGASIVLSRRKRRHRSMKEYDLIAIGSGSATNIIDPMIQDNPKIKIAVIDKDEPGGICLTRGCIPSKILLYPAELVRKIEEARDLG